MKYNVNITITDDNGMFVSLAKELDNLNIRLDELLLEKWQAWVKPLVKIDTPINKRGL